MIRSLYFRVVQAKLRHNRRTSTPGPSLRSASSNGRLTGAIGVNVGGTLFDVSFVEGTCASVFSGCDSPTDFAFNDEASALLASQALIDQVFFGVFDTQPSLVFGCASTGGGCYSETPYRVEAGTAFFAEALNRHDSQLDEVSLFSNSAAAFDTSLISFVNFARFTPQAVNAAVPEPSTWAMMLIGFGAVGVALRRRKRVNHLMQVA